MRQSGNGDPFAIGGGSKRLNNYLVTRSSKGRWFEVDSVGSKNSNSKNESLGLLIDKNIITVWSLILLAGLFILLFRAAYLQIIQGSHFSAVAEGNRIRLLDLKATRGVIYDRNNTLLVENVPSFTLAVVPVDLNRDKDSFNKALQALAEFSGKTAEEILNLINQQSVYSYQPLAIKENLSQEQAILAKILTSEHNGVILKVDNSRNYLLSENQQSLSHVLGYLGKIEENNLEEYIDKNYSIDDMVGKAGIELTYETALKGVNGKQQVEVDATGEAKEIIAEQKSVSGQNLMLSIDLELQQQAEQSLRRVLRANSKSRGAVVILNPNTGEVLALVSLPTFDNNSFSRGISQEEFSALINNENRPLFSRAISGEYPSGSTFKMVVGSAALEEGLISPSSGFNSVGGIAVSSWFFPDWQAGGHGWTNIVKAISESVNTFFYIVGGGYNDFEGLGINRINDYAKKFGLSQKLGIDLPNEAEGFLPSREWKENVKQERWYVGDTYNLSIGQGDILVTPLQVASWTSVFANNGTLYQPHLVTAFLDSENNVVKKVEPKILNKDFISPENISAINQGLRQAVLSGSSIRLYDLPITAAAKTGTAQWSNTSQPHGWVTAYAPYKDPEIVVTVLIEEGIGGTTTAMPVTYDILNWWAENRI